LKNSDLSIIIGVISTTISPGYTSSTTKSIQSILSDLYRKKCACSTTAPPDFPTMNHTKIEKTVPDKLVSTTLTKNTNDSNSNITLEIYAIISRNTIASVVNNSYSISINLYVILIVLIKMLMLINLNE
jgi:hypothetical protein